MRQDWVGLRSERGEVLNVKLRGVAAVLWACLMFWSASVYADLPSPAAGKPGIGQTNVGDLAMSFGEQKALEQKLARSVVAVYAESAQNHPPARGKRVFDGAAAAVFASDVADIAKPEFVPSDDKTDNARSNSFFDGSYRRVSSPFAQEDAKPGHKQAKRQYYLTTADWLTGAQKVTVSAGRRELAARIEYRDDAQNVAVLSTERDPAIESAAIYDFEGNGNVLPGAAFLLLQPDSVYRRMTAHALSLTQHHAYATSNHAARNGYPMFARNGELVGLSVGPVPTHTQAYIVHAGLIDRALHPQKYDRTAKETIELRELSGDK